MQPPELRTPSGTLELVSWQVRPLARRLSGDPGPIYTPADRPGPGWMNPTPTSFYGNLVIVSQGLSLLGLDSDEILASADVDLAKYAEGDQRVPWELVDRVWSLAVEKTGDPTLALDVVEALNPAVYRSLGIALICSSTLRDFFQRFERYFAVMSTLEKTRFVETAESAAFVDTRLVDYSEHTLGCHADAFAAFVVKFIRLMYKPDYAPLRVELAWTPPPEWQGRYPKYFGAPVSFGHADSAVFVDLADLDQPLAGANPEIARQNDHVVMSVLEKLEELDLPLKAYAKLIEFLPSGDCRRERVARSLHMSESAFQKKLRLAGTSYQQVLDATRSELARHYLADPAISVDEVAYLLGFSDCSNFIRAFKRWLGTTPSEYRAGLSNTA